MTKRSKTFSFLNIKFLQESIISGPNYCNLVENKCSRLIYWNCYKNGQMLTGFEQQKKTTIRHKVSKLPFVYKYFTHRTYHNKSQPKVGESQQHEQCLQTAM